MPPSEPINDGHVTVTQAELAAAWDAFQTARDAYIAIRERLEEGASVALGERDCRACYDGFFGLKIILAKSGWRRKAKAQAGPLELS